ncbi:MAG: ABC transporter ATP-binding protein [Acidiferrobacteraceae bacterium]
MSGPETAGPVSSPAIRISGLRKHYGLVPAVDGIDLEVRRGEFFGLLGPNGAGKSTLINIMAGLARADEGTVSILGHDVVTDYRQARRALGVVPQEIVFDPFFTVREVLALQAGYFGLGRESEAWREELLSALMLTEKGDANMRSLSGGMKRRVLIAQALVHRPEVVVLDEPTAGVDVELRQLLWVFIRRLQKEGHTILLTTHYLEEAELLCDRIAIVNSGRIIALDSKENLLSRNFRQTLCVTLSADSAPVPATLLAKASNAAGNLLEFRLEKGVDSTTEILDDLRRSGVKITDLHTQQTDLEDVFLELTRRPMS